MITNSEILIKSAAEVFGITKADILSSKKTQTISLARQIVMTLWASNHSLQSSCLIVGRAHHTTAVYAVSKINQKLNYCEYTRSMFDQVIEVYNTNASKTPKL